MKKTVILMMVVLLISALTIGCSSALQKAEVYPAKTITILVPFSAGGGADLMARAMQTELQKELGVSVVVENKTGANGGIAMAALSSSKPDGYTIILTTTGPSTIAPNISNIGYTNKNFAPICQVADLPTGLAVHKNSGINSLNELFKAAEANPGKFTYGTSGTGSTHSLAVEGLLLSVGKKGLLTHVPFEGGSQAVTALLGGQINASANILTELKPNADSGTFKILGIASAERSAIDPNVPTFKEQGFDNVQSTWYGIAAPAGTPQEVIIKLDKTFKKVLENPEVVKVFEKLKTPISYLDHKTFTEKWNKFYELNAKLAKELGIK